MDSTQPASSFVAALIIPAMLIVTGCSPAVIIGGAVVALALTVAIWMAL